MKNPMRNKVNLIFSSFLVIGYIICSFFFSTLAQQAGGAVSNLIQSLILVLFGGLLFYATRVGEGKQVKRFSLAVLLLLVVPCVYIIAASFLSFLPFHDQLAPILYTTDAGKAAQFQPVILMLACVGLGYGAPYTFLSGYEIKPEEEEIAEEAEADTAGAPVEGGVAEELAEAEAAAEATAEEAVEEAAEVTEEAAQEAAEEAQEAVEEAAEEKTEETGEKE